MMNKEPLGLYIFRFLVACGLFAFMAMLYWSSLLLEEDMRGLRTELAQVKAALQDLARQGPRSSAPAEEHEGKHPPLARKMDPKYPNLLKEDPYYEVTLPKLLGIGFKPYGIRKGDSLGKPDNLHPFTNWVDVSAWRSMCTVSASKLQFGIYETMAPDMAIKIEERPMAGSEASEYWVHLRDGVYWVPLSQSWFGNDITLAPHFFKKHQVTAHDFKFYFDAMINPHNQMPGAVAARNYYGDVREVEVVDDLTFIVRWKTEKVKGPDGKEVEKVKYVAKSLTGGLQPLPRFVYQYLPDGSKIVEEDSAPDFYSTDSVWAQQFAQHWAKNIIVSCGPWIFEGMNEQGIRFRRNPDHYFPLEVLVEGLEVRFRDGLEGMWQDFVEVKVDTYPLPSDQIVDYENFLKTPVYEKQKEDNLAIHRLDYVGRVYFYIGWNEARPMFSTAKVRQAMTMAINRDRIIKQNLNGMGVPIHGTFYVYSNSNDASIKPWPYDPEKARRLLEEEGWYDSDGDGILDKEIEGKRVPFQFTLVYWVKNPTAKAIVDYIATALKEIGVICNLRGVDIADLSMVFDDKSFDALMMGWGLATPPENPRQLWYSAGAKQKGSSNAIGFANAEVDKIIDALDYEYNQGERIKLYHRFDRIIHEEQPYTFLYTPKSALLYRDYVQNVFLPVDRKDLIPGATIAEPDSNVFWLKRR